MFGAAGDDHPPTGSRDPRHRWRARSPAVNAAVIGLGAIRRRLPCAGSEMTGWTRSRARHRGFANLDLVRAPTVAGAVTSALVVVASLPGPAAVREVLLGPAGAPRLPRPGTVVTDMSTSSPEQERLPGVGGEELAPLLLDAPVSGRVGAAESGPLAVPAGGPPEALAVAHPELDALAARVAHVGPVGHGKLAKAAIQLLVGGPPGVIAEAVVLLGAGGASAERALEAIVEGRPGPPMVRGRRR